MGVYWGATDLSFLLPQPVLGVPLLTGSSNPISLTEFSTVISMTEGEFHAAAAEGGYSFPIPAAASTAFDYAKKVVSDGAQAYVLRRIGGQSQLAGQLESAYNEALKAIRDGKVTLLAATPLSEAEGGKQNARGGGIASPYISASYLW
jgi:hypothetical protein